MEEDKSLLSITNIKYSTIKNNQILNYQILYI